ncbi:serine hydrolase domain-containing protein [Nonomuraea typhae]|uniref:Serine hydrolase domain-containing protein n=1 Tax=Nonomuraea typhae TaxID=2603600 RepID=A0ABW7YZJ7_9ACTN
MGIRTVVKKNFRYGMAAAVAGAVVAASMSGPASAQVVDGPGSRALQRDVDAVRATGASGVLASVTTSKGHSGASSGVADLRSRRPVPQDAYYRIGSTTKAFVATVVLQLAGEGRLTLDDTVERWLPGLVKGNGNDGAKISVRQVLQHTGGIPEYSDGVPLEKVTTPEGFHRERFRTHRAEELLAMAMRHKPVFEPGRGWAYSNTNYVLAGMIIEKVTGNPWPQEVHQRIVEPLGLRHTLIPGTSAYLPEPRLSAYKRLSPGGPLTEVSLYAAGHADDSMISTTGDVGRFLRALLGGRLLRPAELKQMRQTVPATPFRKVWRDAGYGLGLMKRRLPCGGWVWFHGGGIWNSLSDNAVTSDGRASAAVAIGSLLGPGESPERQYKSSAALIDHALCSGS